MTTQTTLTDFVHNGAGFEQGFSNVDGAHSDYLEDSTLIHDVHDPYDPDPGSKLAEIKTLEGVVMTSKKKKPVVQAAAVAGIMPEGKNNRFLLPGLILAVALIAGVSVYFLTKKTK